ncbi:MAG: hypothetical protein VX294_09620 [Candidatus Latescibacterota bacterium]|nr:hypothetical protein [Candidatus Latescibacterota bacterium]
MINGTILETVLGPEVKIKIRTSEGVPFTYSHKLIDKIVKKRRGSAGENDFDDVVVLKNGEERKGFIKELILGKDPTIKIMTNEKKLIPYMFSEIDDIRSDSRIVIKTSDEKVFSYSFEQVESVSYEVNNLLIDSLPVKAEVHLKNDISVRRGEIMGVVSGGIWFRPPFPKNEYLIKFHQIEKIIGQRHQFSTPEGQISMIDGDQIFLRDGGGTLIGQFEGQDEFGAVQLNQNDSSQWVDADAIKFIVLSTSNGFLGPIYMKNDGDFYIHLKDGSGVRGKIVKKYQNGNIKLLMSDGAIVVNYSDMIRSGVHSQVVKNINKPKAIKPNKIVLSILGGIGLSIFRLKK